MGAPHHRRIPAARLSYQRLLARLDSWFQNGVRGALPVIVPCRSGCTACCHGPFDISAADAHLVATAVAELPGEVAAGVRARAAEQLRRGQERVPTWHAPWRVDDTADDALDRMCEALADEACPALDPGDGHCLIHISRPATCRLMGLAVRTADGETIENLCPIQQEFPAYAALAPTPLDLMEFEVDAAEHDLEAAAEGWHATTVAGAVAG